MSEEGKVRSSLLLVSNSMLSKFSTSSFRYSNNRFLPALTNMQIVNAMYLKLAVYCYSVIFYILFLSTFVCSNAFFA